MEFPAFISNLPSTEDVRTRQTENQARQIENRALAKKAKEEAQLEYERKCMLFAEAYKKLMADKIEEAIKVLMDSPGKFCVSLVLNPKYELVLDDNSKMNFHIVHYGGKPKLKPKCYGYYDWKTRTTNSFFVGLFKDLQTVLLNNRGYYLLDISDPAKSHSFVVNLYLAKPYWYDDARLLWHGLNKI